MSYQNYSIPVMQSRLNQMEQQYPQFQQNGYYGQAPVYQSPFTVQQNQAIAQGLKGRPVTSIDEAKASMIDLDGSVFVFPDYGNNKIYTKQINLDGTATIKTYTLDTSGLNHDSDNTHPAGTHDYSDDIVLMKDEIESLKIQIGELKSMKGVQSNVRSNANVRVNDESAVTK